MKFTLSIISLSVTAVAGFSSALFQETPQAQQTFPSKTDGVEIELPDFDEFFNRAQQVSPLARVAIEGNDLSGAKGFGAVDKSCK